MNNYINSHLLNIILCFINGSLCIKIWLMYQNRTHIHYIDLSPAQRIRSVVVKYPPTEQDNRIDIYDQYCSWIEFNDLHETIDKRPKSYWIFMPDRDHNYSWKQFYPILDINLYKGTVDIR